MTEVWISAAGLCGATLLGSVLGFFIKELPHKWNDTILGYCAGVMLAASTIGLIVPAFEMEGADRWWIASCAVMVGAFFLNLLCFITPHLHHLTGLHPEEHSQNSHVNHIMLFVMAIAIHKLPEGVAAGVSISDISTEGNPWTVTLAISLQNIPEGMVIIAPLLLAGVTRMRTLLISLAIGLLEIVGVWIGFVLGAISEVMRPRMLGFAGGAMLYVTSEEMIPETHAHGFQKQATYALLLGFITLIVIEMSV